MIFTSLLNLGGKGIEITESMSQWWDDKTTMDGEIKCWWLQQRQPGICRGRKSNLGSRIKGFAINTVFAFQLKRSCGHRSQDWNLLDHWVYVRLFFLYIYIYRYISFLFSNINLATKLRFGDVICDPGCKNYKELELMCESSFYSFFFWLWLWFLEFSIRKKGEENHLG